MGHIYILEDVNVALPHQPISQIAIRREDYSGSTQRLLSSILILKDDVFESHSHEGQGLVLIPLLEHRTPSDWIVVGRLYCYEKTIGGVEDVLDLGLGHLLGPTIQFGDEDAAIALGVEILEIGLFGLD